MGRLSRKFGGGGVTILWDFLMKGYCMAGRVKCIWMVSGQFIHSGEGSLGALKLTVGDRGM